MPEELPTGTVTMLFTDIEGSTALLSRLGPSGYADVLSTQRRIIRSAVNARGGYEMGTEGDSFFVVFSSARDAVAAALAAQRELTSTRWPDAPARVRMGLHTGEPSRHENGYVGLDVHRAARIAAAANGGQVVVSETTRGLVGDVLPDGAVVRDLGWHRFKDLAEAEHVYQLTATGLEERLQPLKSLGTRANLPVPLAPLIGREEEAARLRSLVGDPGVRLVSLTGPGGIGKSRLALAVAADLDRDFPEGVFFVRLAAATSADQMWSMAAETLGVTPNGSAAESVTRHLSDRRALLVLDNLEQIGDAGAVVSALLSGAGRVTGLATSRRPLRLQGEAEFPLSPLGLPDQAGTADLERVQTCGAVALFVQQARAARPTFALTPDNVHDVVAICRRLDGLPLAILLAAARTRLLSPRALLARLDDSLALGSRQADLPERQQTLAVHRGLEPRPAQPGPAVGLRPARRLRVRLRRRRGGGRSGGRIPAGRSGRGPGSAGRPARTGRRQPRHRRATEPTGSRGSGCCRSCASSRSTAWRRYPSAMPSGTRTRPTSQRWQRSSRPCCAARGNCTRSTGWTRSATTSWPRWNGPSARGSSRALIEPGWECGSPAR